MVRKFARNQIGDDCRTTQATTWAHCLNLVFTISEFSPMQRNNTNFNYFYSQNLNQ